LEWRICVCLLLRLLSCCDYYAYCRAVSVLLFSCCDCLLLLWSVVLLCVRVLLLFFACCWVAVFDLFDVECKYAGDYVFLCCCVVAVQCIVAVTIVLLVWCQLQCCHGCLCVWYNLWWCVFCLFDIHIAGLCLVCLLCVFGLFGCIVRLLWCRVQVLVWLFVNYKCGCVAGLLWCRVKYLVLLWLVVILLRLLLMSSASVLYCWTALLSSASVILFDFFGVEMKCVVCAGCAEVMIFALLVSLLVALFGFIWCRVQVLCCDYIVRLVSCQVQDILCSTCWCRLRLRFVCGCLISSAIFRLRVVWFVVGVDWKCWCSNVCVFVGLVWVRVEVLVPWRKLYVVLSVVNSSCLILIEICAVVWLVWCRMKWQPCKMLEWRICVCLLLRLLSCCDYYAYCRAVSVLLCSAVVRSLFVWLCSSTFDVDCKC